MYTESSKFKGRKFRNNQYYQYLSKDTQDRKKVEIKAIIQIFQVPPASTGLVLLVVPSITSLTSGRKQCNVWTASLVIIL